MSLLYVSVASSVHPWKGATFFFLGFSGSEATKWPIVPLHHPLMMMMMSME
jgi:hypothetical protein